MTISARSGASWATGSTSLSVSLPSGVSAGDMLILTVGGKPYDATINTPTGWTLIGSQQTNGSTASGVDSGSVTWAVFYKKATASESSVSVSITSGNVFAGAINCFTKTKGAWRTPTAYFGSDTTSATDFEIVGTGSINIFDEAGDGVLAFGVLPGNNATFGTIDIRASGATITGEAKNPATDAATATGDDLAATCAWTTVTSGPAGTAKFTSTLSAAQTGGGALVRLQETDDALFYSIYTADKSAPSAAQIKAGQDVNGSAAVAATSEPSPTTTTTYDFATATGLTAGTAYKVSFVWSDGTNNSTVVTSAAWATTNSGTFSGTDAVDTALFSGVGQATGSFTATDSPDTAAFAGDVYVRGSLAATDAVDTASFAGDVYIRGSLAATETGVDSAGFTASSQVSGSFAATEGADTAAFAGDVLVVGSFSGTDGVDTAIFVTAGGLVGSFSATEDGVDSAFITARGQVFSPEVAANNTWTPVAGKDSTWAKTAFAAKDWTREAR